MLLQLHRSPTALEAPIGKDGDATVADLIEDDTEETAEEAATLGLMTKDMENLLYTLSEREGDVLRLRYGLDDGREKTLEEVGRILLVSSVTAFLCNQRVLPFCVAPAAPHKQCAIARTVFLCCISIIMPTL